MRCLSPIPAYRRDSGEVVVGSEHPGFPGMLLPCGQCIACRVTRAQDWATRLMHESQLHEYSYFVTLSYSEDHLPAGGDLVYADFQRFMKRVRRVSSMFDVVTWQRCPRFYAVGEYGDSCRACGLALRACSCGSGRVVGPGRPHFHCLLFGILLSPLLPRKVSASGEMLYRSPLLERCWPHGHVWVGSVTYQSACYVAKYCLKKVTGSAAGEHYYRLDRSSGEVSALTPEMSHMSLKPGIGARWFDLFGSELYSAGQDRAVVQGSAKKVPRYYDRLLQRSNGISHDWVLYDRERRATDFLSRPMPSPESREAVLRARLSFSRRTLE